MRFRKKDRQKINKQIDQALTNIVNTIWYKGLQPEGNGWLYLASFNNGVDKWEGVTYAEDGLR